MVTTFDEFMHARQAASNDYIRGDATALRDQLTLHDPASFLPPGGAVIDGVDAVTQAQVDGAASFGPRSTGRFDVVNSGVSGELAFWTGRQVATMDIKGHDQPVEMVLRTTEVFRREDGQWKLVHRHADMTST